MERTKTVAEVGRKGRRRWRPGCRALVAGVALGIAALVGVGAAVSALERGAGETHVIADAVEETAGEARRGVTEEFIDVPYWDAHDSTTRNLVFGDCVASEQGSLVCQFSQTHEFVSSLFDRATSRVEGSMTFNTAGCVLPDGTMSTLIARDGGGTITTHWGDEAYFRSRNSSCFESDAVPDGGPTPRSWRVTGGTGRFEDASGLMTGTGAELGNGLDSVSTGTLRVRADLWENLLTPESTTWRRPGP